MKLPTAIAFAVTVLIGSATAQSTHSGGVIYGPKAAFSLTAPNGWVLDNQAGQEQGLPCVLYPKGSSWSDAKTVMYAKIASTDFEDAEAFAAKAMKEMQKERGLPKEKIASGTTRSGHHYFINEYPASKQYSQWERVAYVQLPKAVGYVVLSSRNEASYDKHSAALQQAVETLNYLEQKEVPRKQQSH
jgi:hypothetical protein